MVPKSQLFASPMIMRMPVTQVSMTPSVRNSYRLRAMKNDLSGVSENPSVEQDSWDLRVMKPDFLVSKSRGATARNRQPIINSKDKPKHAKEGFLD